MPRGNPKFQRMFGITRARIDAVRATSVLLTRSVEEGIGLWLARVKRQHRHSVKAAHPSAAEAAPEGRADQAA